MPGRTKKNKKNKSVEEKPKNKTKVAPKKKNTKNEKTPKKKTYQRKKTKLKIRVSGTTKKKEAESQPKVLEETEARAIVDKLLKEDAQKKGQPLGIEELERNKKLILWSGVLFFMVLIAFFWIANTKKMIKENKLNQKKVEITDWESLTEEVGEKIEQMKEDLKNIQSFSNNNISTSTEEFEVFSETATSSAPAASPEDLEILKKKIEELNKEDQEKIKFYYN